MTATEVHEDTTLASWDPDEPMFAHKTYAFDRYTALCGRRLLGIKAGPNPRRCPECLRLMREMGYSLMEMLGP